MADQLKTIMIHGKWKTQYNADTENGMKRLQYDLDLNECAPFFDLAKRSKEADFEDDNDKQYTLTYDKGDFTYLIMRRKF